MKIINNGNQRISVIVMASLAVMSKVTGGYGVKISMAFVIS
jgi:hypothetical protein